VTSWEVWYGEPKADSIVSLGVDRYRPGDTRWSSHYGAIISLILIFSSIINAVEDIVEDDLYSE
jgi:hypothetical protein